MLTDLRYNFFKILAKIHFSQRQSLTFIYIYPKYFSNVLFDAESESQIRFLLQTEAVKFMANGQNKNFQTCCPYDDA
jgi:hypothetical protein